jgi:hypothetical protein
MAKQSPRRKPAGRRSVSVTEFRELQRTMEQHTADLNLQFRRIAQIQAELDGLKKTLMKV